MEPALEEDEQATVAAERSRAGTFGPELVEQRQLAAGEDLVVLALDEPGPVFSSEILRGRMEREESTMEIDVKDDAAAEYLRSWNYAEAVRRRLANYTGGIFRLDTREGVIFLEIGGTAQAVVRIKDNASGDVFRCFRVFVENEVQA